MSLEPEAEDDEIGLDEQQRKDIADQVLDNILNMSGIEGIIQV